jgi:hypothetical protein
MNTDQGQPSVPILNSSASLSGDSLFSNKNIFIVVLLILLVFSLLGINLLIVFGNFFQLVMNILGPTINQILSAVGYTSGTVLNQTTNVVEKTAKTGVDIAGGAVHSVGNLLIDAGKNSIIKPSEPVNPPTPPAPDTTENPIQKPISAAKTNWCLVGEYEGRRGCIEIGEHDKCISGQVFPNQKMCLNPNLSQNAKP